MKKEKNRRRGEQDGKVIKEKKQKKKKKKKLWRPGVIDMSLASWETEPYVKGRGTGQS